MTEYDVIICGAGPGGATAAKFLAEADRRVLLLDKDVFPRDKPCGGGLVRHVDEFDYLMDNMDLFLEGTCKGHMSFDATLAYTVEYHSEKPLFYNIRRREFDAALVRFAAEAGADLKEDHRVKDIRIDNDQVTVSTDKESFTGQAVIGAMGPHDLVAKHIRRSNGLPDWSEEDIGIALVEEFPVDPDFIKDKYGEDYTSLFHHGYNDSVYGWVFPKTEVLNIGLWPKPEKVKDLNLKEEFDKYIQMLKQEGYVPDELESKNMRGAPLPASGPLAKTFGNRALIVGDAAGFVSPLSGEGIYYAMHSGKIASITLNEALEKNDLSPSILRRYQTLWTEAWGEDLRVNRFFARQVAKRGTSLIKLASMDKVLTELYANLFMGTISSSRNKAKIMARVARDVPLGVARRVNPLRILRK